MGAPVESRQVIRFGVFEVDVRAGELRRSGTRIKLQEQPFQILLALLEKPGDVITREDLRSRLWPADTFVDFDHSLNTAIKKLRQALSDDADNPRFVETVARRGYRFLGDVKTDAAVAGPAPGPQPVPEPDVTPSLQTLPRSRSPKRAWVIATLTVLALIVAGATLLYLSRHDSAKGLNSIAVLPLDNLSGDSSQDFFADAMTEALTAELAKGSSLRVISRTSSMQYKHTNKSLPQIGKELNADAVVEGSVTRSGDRVRITAQLVRSADDRHLWADSFERNLTDILRLQREVAQAIVQRVNAQLDPKRQNGLKEPMAVNARAYESYLSGLGSLSEAPTKAGLERAIRNFDEAIQRDPNFALGYVGLANSYSLLGQFRWLPPREAYGKTKEALAKARRIDDTLARAQDTLATVTWQFDWDWKTAEKLFREQLNRNPNDSEAHRSLAWFFAWSGRRDEAFSELAATRVLDPAQTYLFDETGLYYHLRDYPRMLDSAKRAAESDADVWVLHYFLGVAYDGLHRPQDAIPEYRRAAEMSVGDTDALSGLAHGYAANHQNAEAEAIVRDLLDQSKSKYVSQYMIAAIYASLGRKDEAFNHLDKAFEERSSDLMYFIYADMRIDSLRSDPRFADLLRRMGLPPR